MGFGLVNFVAVAVRHAQQQQRVPVSKVHVGAAADGQGARKELCCTCTMLPLVNDSAIQGRTAAVVCT